MYRNQKEEKGGVQKRIKEKHHTIKRGRLLQGVFQNQRNNKYIYMSNICNCPPIISTMGVKQKIRGAMTLFAKGF